MFNVQNFEFFYFKLKIHLAIKNTYLKCNINLLWQVNSVYYRLGYVLKREYNLYFMLKHEAMKMRSLYIKQRRTESSSNRYKSIVGQLGQWPNVSNKTCIPV